MPMYRQTCLKSAYPSSTSGTSHKPPTVHLFGRNRHAKAARLISLHGNHVPIPFPGRDWCGNRSWFKAHRNVLYVPLHDSRIPTISKWLYSYRTEPSPGVHCQERQWINPHSASTGNGYQVSTVLITIPDIQQNLHAACKPDGIMAHYIQHNGDAISNRVPEKPSAFVRNIIQFLSIGPLLQVRTVLRFIKIRAAELWHISRC